MKRGKEAMKEGEETLISCYRLRMGENDGDTRNVVNFINNLP